MPRPIRTEPAAVSQSSSVEPPPAPEPLGKLEYGRWMGRLVSAFSSFGQRIKRLFGYGSSEKAAQDCYRSYRLAGHVQFQNPIQRSLHDYHVACVMDFHRICHVKERVSNGRSELVVSGGSSQIGEALLNEVDKSVACSTIELAYKFLAEDRSLPEGFLQRALIPDLIRLAMDEYGIDSQTAKQSVERLVSQAGITSNKKVTFERILEIKNKLRWLHAPEGSNPQLHAAAPVAAVAVNPEAPGLTPPRLDRPVKTNYVLDPEDKEFIQSVVDRGGGIKLENHDTRNKLKRLILRNKKTAGLNAFGMAVSAVLAGLVTGGIGAVVTIFSYIIWTGAWCGGTELVRMIKAMRALQQAELSRDYQLNPDDLGALSEMDEKRFRTFLKSMRYICSHETLTRIFNAYSELEIDAQTLLDMTEDNADLDSVIKVEEGTARYLYRRRQLKAAFNFYRRFYEAASADVSRMEQEWEECLGRTWETMFANMQDNTRKRLFNRAANDKRVVGVAYRFQTDQSEWLNSVFPMMQGEDGRPVITDEAREELEHILDEELPDVELTEEERRRFNAHANQVANAFTVAKSSARSYLKSWLKGAIRSTSIHGFKIGWHAVDGVPKLEISPYLPRPSLDGLAIFAFFFVIDLLLTRKNNRINQKRFEHIAGKTEEPATTWNMGWRERTGREEMNTIRKLAKDNLQDFEKRVLELHDLHEKTLEDFRIQERLGNHLTEYEAAVRILQWQHHHHMINEMMVGAIGRFYSSTVSKTEYWDQQLADIIPPQEAL